KFYDDKSKLQYTVANDRENLYLCIRATNEQTQLKIFRAGMEIWIDTTGKAQEHHVGILFPLPNNEIKKTTQSPSDVRTSEKPVGNFLKNKYVSSYKMMDLRGFKSPIGGSTPLQNTFGIAVNIDWDSTDVMTYEATIPFKTFYKDVLATSDTTKRLGISIVLHALQMPAGGGEHGGGGGVPGGGGGGVPGGGGGMHGGGGHGGGGGGGHGGGGGGHGGGGGGAQGSTYMFETNSIKMLFQLSTKKRI
ncbi:MAG: hypothetical protein ACXVPU_10350, partial [Bacteroidia bacterium]